VSGLLPEAMTANLSVEISSSQSNKNASLLSLLAVLSILRNQIRLALFRQGRGQQLAG
jgi:hypothetical protein